MVWYVNAWQLTGNKKYMDEAEKVWNFIKLRIIDHEIGECFWKVDRKGEPYISEEKAGFWKCPYHNTRSLIEVVSRLRKKFLLNHIN
jgi:mannobiose 2-epimerase